LYNGIYSFELTGILRKLNPELYFNTSRFNYYRNAGLYHQGGLVIAVPLNQIPEHTIFERDCMYPMGPTGEGIRDKGWRTIFGALIETKRIKEKDLKKELGRLGHRW